MTESSPKCCTIRRRPSQTECQIISPLTASVCVHKFCFFISTPTNNIRRNHPFVPLVHNLLYEAGPVENGALSSNYQVRHMIQYLVYESKFFAFRGLPWQLEWCQWCVPSLSGGLTGGGGVWGYCSLPNLGTQDKRSQSKGDVEVMKTKALRGRELLEAAVMLSTSDPLAPSSTARRISWPSLYGNLAPHENA